MYKRQALLWNLLFIPPVMTFKIERLEDALMCLFFFLVALSTGRLTSRPVSYTHLDLQEVKFQAPVKARYFRFSALSETQGRDYAAVAELDIIPVKK